MEFPTVAQSTESLHRHPLTTDFLHSVPPNQSKRQVFGIVLEFDFWTPATKGQPEPTFFLFPMAPLRQVYLLY